MKYRFRFNGTMIPVEAESIFDENLNEKYRLKPKRNI